MDTHEILSYPLDTALILRKRKKLRRVLMEQGEAKRELKIAVLGGSTTSELVCLIELFLLGHGVQSEIYESDYGLFFEEAVFTNEALTQFSPDVVYVHTSVKNLAGGVDAAKEKWVAVWDGLKALGCTIIQNNFESPWERPLGNLDGSVEEGKTYQVRELNAFFAASSRDRPELVVHDIHYLAAQIGLNKWVDRSLWYSSKYAMSYDALVHMAFSLSNLMLGVLGQSKKALILDLDNTLWGGVIGDDGVEGILLGPDSPQAEAHLDLQAYVKALGSRGVALAVASKNDQVNAEEGFTHPDAVLQLRDFAAFQANWNPKHQNLAEICAQINLSPEALVFLDDNEMERDLVATQLPGVAVPEVGSDIAHYIEHLDRGGYFETAGLSVDDLRRADAYRENRERADLQQQFTDFGVYLDSLEMEAEIDRFQAVYLDRITQLTNKTNQFNLTTRRFQHAEMEGFAQRPEKYLTLYGRLKDRFGDNGLISVVVGEWAEDQSLRLFLWLMSCRVLKRGMETAMFEVVLERARAAGVQKIVGEYRISPKNQMVSELYGSLGFVLQEENEEGSTWIFDVGSDKPKSTHYIKVSPYDA